MPGVRLTAGDAVNENEVDNPQPIYTPDNEPYLGRVSVFGFDNQISFTLYVNGFIAGYTRAHHSELSPLQTAAAQIIPQGISLALSVRELIRQGYLFGALVLVRPLIERAANYCRGCALLGELSPRALDVIAGTGERLREEGYEGGYTQVKKAIRGLEVTGREVFVLINHGAARAAFPLPGPMTDPLKGGEVRTLELPPREVAILVRPTPAR